MVTYLLGENPSLGNRSFHHRTHEVNDVIAKPDNVVRSFTNKNGTFQIRESLFAGPGGFLKQDPKAHNFPYSFDDVILREKPIAQTDGSLLYRKTGEINGRDGIYEIALNPDTGTIFHRTWRKLR